MRAIGEVFLRWLFSGPMAAIRRSRFTFRPMPLYRSTRNHLCQRNLNRGAGNGMSPDSTLEVALVGEDSCDEHVFPVQDRTIGWFDAGKCSFD